MAKSKDEDKSCGSLEGQLIDDLNSGFYKAKSSAVASYLLDSSANVNEWVSTGSILLDIALSNKKDGGIPVGRLTTISGLEGAGKTLQAAYILANTQKMGGIAIMIDSECSMSLDVFRAAGVDVNKMVYLQANTIEDVFRAMETIVIKTQSSDNKKLITIVWDSVAATSSLAEVEGDYSDHIVGVNAKRLSQGLRKYIPICNRHRVCLVFINQLRYKMGVSYGDPYVMPGGKAIPFHSSIILRLSNYKKIKSGDNLVGRVIKCDVKKNKVAPPMKSIFYTIRWGDKPGAWLDEGTTILEAAEGAGILSRISPLKYKFISDDGEEYSFTKKKFSDMINNDPKFYDSIKNSLCDKLIITSENLTSEFVKEDIKEGEEF